MNVFYSGSFDVFHIGHLLALQDAAKVAKEHKGRLIVGVNTNELYFKHKGKLPLTSYANRKKIIEGLECVDEVVAQEEPTMTKNLEKYKIDIYVICDEYLKAKEEERAYLEKNGGRIISFPYHRYISSTSVKNNLTLKEKAAALVSNWQVKDEPEYRGFYCANCLKIITEAWHIWILKSTLKIEIHLCDNCYGELK